MKLNLVILIVSNFFLLIHCKKEDPSIVVIGAGASGIAAASKLWNHGFTNLKILEAEPNMGGRIKSVVFGDMFVDLGAQWCHGEKDNIVYNMVKDLNLLEHSNLSTEFLYSNGELIDTEFGEKLIDFSDSVESITDEDLEKTCNNMVSVEECFEKKFNTTFVETYKDNPEKLKISLEAHDWLETDLLAYDSSFTLSDSSLKSDWKECEGDSLLNWKGNGYSMIFDVMLLDNSNSSELKKPLVSDLLVNKEVTKIIWNNNTDKNSVQCLDNTVYEADHVIFTGSLGVLKASHDKIFQPELPNEKVRAITGFGFGAIMKIFLHFNTTWWNPHDAYVFIWSAEDKNKILSEFDKGPKKNGRSWVTTLDGFIPAENNPKVLIGFFAGEMIIEMEKESDKVLKDGCTYIFRKFLGKKYSVEEPDNIIKSTWYNNPHFQGTYSYESVKGNSSGSKFPEALAAPLNRSNGYPSVQFAGEATHPYYFSTVHGAIETGYREADRIINLYAQK